MAMGTIRVEGLSALIRDLNRMDRELGRWEIRDLRLSYNRLPHAHLQEAMEGFASMFNFWSKRSGRMPPGHVEEIRRRIKRLSHSNKPSAWNLSFPVQ